MALQDAGITRESIRGSDTGVYIGRYDALDLDLGRKEMFYLTTHSTHFILWLNGVGQGPLR